MKRTHAISFNYATLRALEDLVSDLVLPLSIPEELIDPPAPLRPLVLARLLDHLDPDFGLALVALDFFEPFLDLPASLKRAYFHSLSDVLLHTVDKTV